MPVESIPSRSEWWYSKAIGVADSVIETVAKIDSLKLATVLSATVIAANFLENPLVDRVGFVLLGFGVVWGMPRPWGPIGDKGIDAGVVYIASTWISSSFVRFIKSPD